ncbi:MAG TPA: ComF family protein [Noviherbaspirillum sp.]|jgi:ComF family protein|uniref:ComF family protein n=1 Tax=Noviherbaspirillum sp. TaxID=1926288 RepID=UPI002F957BC8
MLTKALHRSQRLSGIVRALIPCACALCGGESGDIVCDGCNRQFFTARIGRCRMCAIPLPADASAVHICGACLQRPPAFDAAVAAVDYVQPLEQLVLGLKFGGRLPLAALLAQKLHAACQAAQVARPSLLTAVPLGSARLAERGFNQAAEIARPLAQLLQLPLDLRLLERRRDTLPQALLHPDERRRNMRRAFTVAPSHLRQVHGAHVAVVDDVMTTGETLSEAARALKRFGAARVTALVFARTVD